MTGPAPGLPSLEVRNGEMLMGVRVIPSAPRDAPRGVYGYRLKVAVSASPEHGKANKRVIHALAEWLDVRIDSIRIQTGHAGRDKVVAFSRIE